MHKNSKSPAKIEKLCICQNSSGEDFLNAGLKSAPTRLHQEVLAATMVCFLFSPNLVLASSDDAWEQFRSDVKNSCTKASSNFSINNISVDDFGTESYGFSIISGTVKGGSRIQQLRVCVFDKKSKKSEILEIGNLEAIKSLMTDSPEQNATTQPEAINALSRSDVLGVVANHTGQWRYVTPKRVNPPILGLWGYDKTKPEGNRLIQYAVSYFEPIDSITLIIRGEARELPAFPNVTEHGDPDKNGNFQCTALISQYLSLLGFRKAPATLPNGRDVVKHLTESANKEFFSPIDPKDPPQVGSIVSMEAGTGGVPDGIGHVAIVKAISAVEENKIVATLIEQNIQNGKGFSADRTIEFFRGANKKWGAEHAILKGSTFHYPVINWTTPVLLP